MSAVKTLAVAALVSTVIGNAALMANSASAKDGYEKCGGVAKAHQNDCAGNGHTCAGQAKKDHDPKEWKYVKIGTCKALGGTLIKG